MVFKSSDIMVMGCYFYSREEKKKKREMHAANPNIRTFCSSVIVLRENALQQKRKRMIKGKKTTRTTFISAPLKAQQEEVAVFAKPQKETQLMGSREGGGEGRAEAGSRLVLFFQKDIVNNGKV